MATDHRGRGLHAGRRTAQEQGWQNQGKDYYERNPDKSSMLAVSKIEHGHWAWAVDLDEDSTAGKTVSNSLYDDLGRKETYVSPQPYASKNKDAVTYGVLGSTRTSARAMIAAEAMKKRIDEGRDLKTGRPKK